MPISFLGYSSDYTAPKNMKARESASPSSSASFIDTAERSGPRPASTKERLSTLLSKEDPLMADSAVEILLVEDNPNDVELTLRVLKKNNISNRLHVVRDGAEALEFIFCTGAYADRDIKNGPKVVLLDLKLPKVDGLDVLRQIKADPRTKSIPVVVLTSSREEQDIVESYRLGTNRSEEHTS